MKEKMKAEKVNAVEMTEMADEESDEMTVEVKAEKKSKDRHCRMLSLN